MKKCISLIMAILVACSMMVIPATAAEAPTATYSATLVNETMPAAGEKFVVAISAKDISSGLFKAGGVYLEWDADVATPVDYYEDEPTPVENDYFIGNVYNEIVGRTGKFAYVAASSVPNKWNVSIYISSDARDQSPEEVTDLVMYEVAFMLNEGYTYDDFALTLSDAEGLFGDEVSTSDDGHIMLESIEPVAPDIYYVAANGQTEEAIFDLPEVISGTAYVTYTFNTVNQRDALIGLNSKAQMEGSYNYFASSSAYLSLNYSGIYYHDGYGKTWIGDITTPGTYNVEAMVDVINKIWSVTVTDTEGNVVGSMQDKSFRNTLAEVIDCLVVLDNAGGGVGAVTVTNLKIINTTPSYIGTIAFNYVDAEGTVLKTIERTAEIGAEVSVEAETFEVNGVKYEAPATSAIVEDGAVITVECTKIEKIAISYTVNGVQVATATAEGVVGSKISYDSGYVATDTAVYRKEGSFIVDRETFEVKIELAVVAEGLVSAASQVPEAIHTLEKQIEAAGTVTFDLTVINPKDTLIALDNAETIEVSGNYFRDSSAYIQLKNGRFMVNDGTGAQAVGVYELGETYSVEFVLDVENSIYTLTITDVEGTEVVKIEDFGMRNDEVDVIDSIVILDNAGAGKGAVVVSNLVVETEEGPTEAPEEPTDEPTEEPEKPTYAPTATYSATLVNEKAPAAGEKFVVAISAKDISSGLFKAGGVYLEWDADVATPVDYYEDEPTPVENDYFIGNVYNEIVGRTGKFAYVAASSVPNKWNVSIYISSDAKDQSPEEVTDLVMYEVAFMLNEGYTYDDFALTLSDAEGLFGDEVSTSDDGHIMLESIESAAPDIYYTDADGITYMAVSDNLISVNGVEGLTNAGNGGALAWETVAAHAVNLGATEGAVYVHPTTIGGGHNVTTMRTFFPIEGGKTYYVTHTLYNNTGAATTSHINAGMSAIIATGDAVYGTHAGLTMYSHVNYGGFNSWSATGDHNDAIYVGDVASRYDYSVPAGYNKVEALIYAPAEATNIMISYGAWGSKELYYGDWAIYEVEAAEEIVDMVINYTDADGNIVATETKTSAVGNTVDVAAGTAVAGADGNYKVVADTTLTFVSGGSTEAVVVDKVYTVTISYTVDGVRVATDTVKGVEGEVIAYNSGNIVTDTGVYVKEGTITIDAENLTAVVELAVVAEGLVSAERQVPEAIHTLEKQIETAGTVTFDLTVINPKDTLIALDNAETIEVSGNYFRDSSAYIQLRDGYFMVNDGTGAQVVGIYELGETYSVEFVLDVENSIYTLTVTDVEGTEVVKIEDFGMRNAYVDIIDSIVTLDNAGAGKGAVVVSNLVVETEEEPTEEPSDEPTEVPSDGPTDEPTEAPSDEPTDEPTEAPSDEPTDEPSDEPTEVPSDEPTDVPTEEPSDEPTEVPSDEPTDVPAEEPSDEPTEAPSDEPTEVPSDEPTDEPSDEPTEVPSDEPTEVPSDEPTDEPSDEPTEVPSDEPTDVPAEEPSDEPTDEPDISYPEEIIIDGLSTITEPCQFNANVFPLDAPDKRVEWSVSDETIAVVSETGLVTPLKNGTVVVTVTAIANPGLKATMSVTTVVSAKIEALTSDKGVWDKAFDKYLSEYVIYVGEDVTEISLTPTYTHGTVTHEGITIISDSNKTVALDDVITVIELQRENVTGCNDSIYTISVIRTDEPIIATGDGVGVDVLLNTDVLPEFEKAIIVVATYSEDGELETTCRRETDGEEGTVRISHENPGPKVVKIMLWENYRSMKPICEPIEITIDK